MLWLSLIASIGLAGCKGIGVSIDVERTGAKFIDIQQTNEGPARIAYVAKYVCGVKKDNDNYEPDLQPGHYATKINVLNHTEQEVTFTKKVFALRGGQHPTEPGFISEPETLGPNFALEMTCKDMANHLGLDPNQAFEGFVEFRTMGFVSPINGELRDPLEVWSVYTYRDEDPN